MYPAVDNDLTVLVDKGNIIAMKKDGSVIAIIYATTTIMMRYDKLDICDAEYRNITLWIGGAT